MVEIRFFRIEPRITRIQGYTILDRKMADRKIIARLEKTLSTSTVGCLVCVFGQPSVLTQLRFIFCVIREIRG